MRSRSFDSESLQFAALENPNPIPKSMNAQELLQCATRLSESNCAYLLFNNGDRGIIVPPGVSGKKITMSMRR